MLTGQPRVLAGMQHLQVGQSANLLISNSVGKFARLVQFTTVTRLT